MTGLLFKLGEAPYPPAVDLKVRVEEVISPEVREMLQLRYDCADLPVAIIGAAPVPVTLRPLAEEDTWEVSSPWEAVTITADVSEFEGELLRTLGDMRTRAMMTFAAVDMRTVN